MKKNKAYLFLILRLVLIILMKNDFFKKSFFIITKSFEERFIIAYKKNQFSGYCSREAHGYIRFIKDEFSVENPPKIIIIAKYVHDFLVVGKRKQGCRKSINQSRT